MTNVRGTKFQDKYKAWIYFTAIFGLYPPGFDLVVKKRWVQHAAYGLSVGMVVMALTYISLFFSLAIFTNVFFNATVFFIYFRRVIACGPLCLKITYHATPFGYKQMSRIFETWNNVINVDYYVKKRETILSERLRKSRWLFAFTVLFSCILLQIPTLLLFTGRNAYGAAYACFPHNPNAWYHYYLVALQFLDFSIGNLGALCFNIFTYTIMLMANTQLTILQDSLREILYDGKQVEDGEKPESFIKSETNCNMVRLKLKKWVQVHQETNIWLEEVKSFFKITSGIKILFLGLYICLAIFTIPMVLKTGRSTELIFIITYTFGNYTLLFFETRLADELNETSSLVFMGAYDTNWCAYPADIRNALKIIQNFSMMRPFSVKTFGIITDNSETFLSIMQSAYNLLSFLLQMEF